MKSNPNTKRRFRTPTVLQMEALECGAACLGMILAYHGRYVPLEQLREACGVSRDGSAAAQVLQAARTYGLKAKGWRVNTVEELQDLPFPLIVFWNFNHYVVVEGYGKGVWYLNDPDRGHRQVTDKEFDEAFTGVALLLEKGPDFQPGGDKPSMLDSLRRRSGGLVGGLTFALLAGLALVGPGLVIPTFSRVFVDDVLVENQESWIKPLLLGMALTALLRAALTWLQQLCLVRLETRLAINMARDFLGHVLKLPMAFFTQRYPGDVASRVAMNNTVARLLSTQVAANLLNALLVVFYLALMLQYDFLLAGVALTVAMLNVLTLRLVGRARKDQNARLLAEQAKLMGVSMGGLQTIETTKASGGEADFFTSWTSHQARAVTTGQRKEVLGLALQVGPGLLTSLNVMTILALGGLRVMQGHLTLGELIAFQSLAASFLLPITGLVNLGSELQEAEGGLNRLDDVLRYAPVPALDKPQPGIPLAGLAGIQNGSPATAANDGTVKLAGWVELRDVTFGYGRLQPPLLEHFSLSLKPGSRVALVGGSGSGKSTVARLVAGLWEPWAGEVLLDGCLRATIPRTVLTSSLSLVDQDIVLFEGTVRENLSLWDPTIPEEDLVRAAQDACIHEVIAARPGGYDSRVEEAGGNFSGGQRQRLEIARALATNPSILVLDEATSALDPLAEQQIVENLRRRGCACVIVAHRLSTVRDCDEIIVLDQGKVLQRGIHGQLSTLPGHYRELMAAY